MDIFFFFVVYFDSFLSFPVSSSHHTNAIWFPYQLFQCSCCME